MARTLAQFHVALDDSLEYQFLEVALHLVVNLVGESEAAVVHRQQETFYFELRIQLALDDLDGVEQLADSSSAKYSHCTGMITLSAAVSEFTVIKPSDGEQSMRI